MATVTLDGELRTSIADAVRSLPPVAITETNLTRLRDGLRDLPTGPRAAFDRLGTACRALLRQNGYVQLRGVMPVEDVRGVLAVGECLGELFTDLTQQSTIVVEASPAIGASLQGNQTEALFLHTDFAMLEWPPSATIIYCRRADPMGAGFGANGVAVAQRIVSRLFGSPALESFFTIPLPFGGRTPSGTDVVLESPVLARTENGLTAVRFHPSRIHHGFRVLGRPASPDESQVLREFMAAAAASRIEIALDLGDFLLVNNRAALHDRTRCTLELGASETRSRVSQILFVQELRTE
jgi:alpha-ketoglutarate-dependent taurine dioxygenase